MKHPFFLLLFGLVFLLHGCIVVENPHAALAPGIWRGVLKLEYRPITPNKKGEPLPEKLNMQFEEVTEGELPFLFEVIYDSPDSFHIEIINGEERIRVDEITVGRDRSTAKDTIRIDFPIFDTHISGLYEEDILEGEWVVTTKKDYRIYFVARHGENHRFTQLRKDPLMDVSGRWEVQFEVETDDPYPAVAEFEQDGNELKGTFLTETGDYRYLEGTVQNDKIYLSTFDGSHAFLFEAKILEDSTLIGSFRSGKHYRTLWEARRNPNASLGDPHEMISVEGPIRFSFPNAAGELVSLEDPRFENKVKIIQILGTWCPNCRDESSFLRDYLNENANSDLVTIGIAFERYNDRDKALQTIAKYQDRMALPYEILWGGHYPKEEVVKSLPMLSELKAYPTLLFLDRNNEVRRIHSGFAGPATSSYAAFKQDFHEFVQTLLNEQKQ